ncbi:histidine phosphatase family protein [Thiomicrorhabdus xiamenensis]|uniref:Histidine phosphatase family protein n=1 Tax=Thiomicrorhabdus xiamenensis TaxID=2739063 RepID=A0A7D4NQT5_9GAMM|nr:histidine phosphatase family protein [Thiomicrorhabdus xiamenensis]QKI89017.1 histidine phosphatase family protein [Thiomicrorhabdus xiamenensis]
MRIDLIRHGACEDDVFLRGRTDSPLSLEGENQMRQALIGLPEPCQIITSPASRCRFFAEQHFKHVSVRQALAERDFGSWDGLSLDEIRAHYPKQLEAYFADPFADDIIPYGENLPLFEARVVQEWDRLCRSECDHLLIFSHSGVQRMVLKRILKMQNEALFNLKIGYAARLTFEVTRVDEACFTHLVEMRQNEHAGVA